jgi:hypothetical protein
MLLLVVGAALFLWGATHTAVACWNYVETQCFSTDPLPQYWGPNGWSHPANSGRYWQRYPNYPYDYVPSNVTSWDWQRVYYDPQHMCNDQIGQALWCAGFPRSNDPAYTTYPSWDSAYVTYGPIDLSQAVAGGCSFYLYNRSEIAHDSVFWGLTTARVIRQNHDSMYIAGVSSQIMQGIDFQQRIMDFSRLHRVGTLDTVSLLGRSQVWVFWRFWSDGNANRDKGAFIDNVSISWDDGGQDLGAVSGAIYKDSTVNVFPLAGDTSYAKLTFQTCAGGIQNYAPFRAVVTVDTSVVLDTIITTAEQGTTYELLTHPWILSPDTHVVRLVLDSMNVIPEVNEANNVATFTYVVPQPHPPAAFAWVTPLDSIEYGDETATLRWESYDDPNNPSTLAFYSTTQHTGCQGLPVEGGTGLPVADGPDSLVWNLTSFNYGRVLNVFVRIHDSYNDTCIYAPYPVIRRRTPTAVGDHGTSVIPDHFYLDQNYPNPFNPATDLRYGVAKSGHVTLKVFDLLGREVAVLVNSEQSPGTYTVPFNGAKLPSGLYLYSLSTAEGTQTRKMMLMK